MNGSAEANGEKKVAWAFDLPARVEVGIAGAAAGVNVGAQCWLDAAAQEGDLAREDYFDVDVRGIGFDVKAAPQVGHVVCQDADPRFRDEILRACWCRSLAHDHERECGHGDAGTERSR